MWQNSVPLLRDYALHPSTDLQVCGWGLQAVIEYQWRSTFYTTERDSYCEKLWRM